MARPRTKNTPAPAKKQATTDVQPVIPPVTPEPTPALKKPLTREEKKAKLKNMIEEKKRLRRERENRNREA